MQRNWDGGATMALRRSRPIPKRRPSSMPCVGFEGQVRPPLRREAGSATERNPRAIRSAGRRSSFGEGLLQGEGSIGVAASPIAGGGRNPEPCPALVRGRPAGSGSASLPFDKLTSGWPRAGRACGGRRYGCSDPAVRRTPVTDIPEPETANIAVLHTGAGAVPQRSPTAPRDAHPRALFHGPERREWRSGMHGQRRTPGTFDPAAGRSVPHRTARGAPTRPALSVRASSTRRSFMSWERVSESVWSYPDSCRVYAVRAPEGMVVVNAGTGRWLEASRRPAGAAGRAGVHALLPRPHGGRSRSGAPRHPGACAVLGTGTVRRSAGALPAPRDLHHLRQCLGPVRAHRADPGLRLAARSRNDVARRPRRPGRSVARRHPGRGESRGRSAGGTRRLLRGGDSLPGTHRTRRPAPVQLQRLPGAVNLVYSTQTLRKTAPDILAPSIGDPMFGNADDAARVRRGVCSAR